MFRLAIFMLCAAVTLAMLVPRLHDQAPDTAAADKTMLVETAAPPSVAADAGNGLAGAVLTRAADGHFYADAQVNGATIRFLVDWGGSDVVLTRADAQRAGIAAGAGEFTAFAQSANGRVNLKPVSIDRIAIGPVSADDVQGAVAESEMQISLLGQSFLTRVGKVEISGDTMRLK